MICFGKILVKFEKKEKYKYTKQTDNKLSKNNR